MTHSFVYHGNVYGIGTNAKIDKAHGLRSWCMSDGLRGLRLHETKNHAKNNKLDEKNSGENENLEPRLEIRAVFLNKFLKDFRHQWSSVFQSTNGPPNDFPKTLNFIRYLAKDMLLKKAGWLRSEIILSFFQKPIPYTDTLEACKSIQRIFKSGQPSDFEM